MRRRVLDGDADGGDAAAPPAFDPAAPLTLSRAQDLAVRRNETLAASGEEYVRALIERDRRAASLLPVVTLRPAYVRQEECRTAPPEFVPPRALDLSVTAVESAAFPEQFAALDSDAADAAAAVDAAIDATACPAPRAAAPSPWSRRWSSGRRG